MPDSIDVKFKLTGDPTWDRASIGEDDWEKFLAACNAADRNPDLRDNEVYLMFTVPYEAEPGQPGTARLTVGVLPGNMRRC